MSQNQWVLSELDEWEIDDEEDVAYHYQTWHVTDLEESEENNRPIELIAQDNDLYTL